MRIRRVLEEVYTQVKDTNLEDCAKLNCFLCAKGGAKNCQKLHEAVVLLPYELDVLSSLGVRGFPEIEVCGMKIGYVPPHTDCPFNVGGWCGIHGRHPIDCRSFPLVPSINEAGDLVISIAVGCPAVPTWEFVKLWVEVWKKLWEVVPESWFRFYSGVPGSPTKPVILIKSLK
ncbi:hypothetical protein [Thermocrinis albus]|uniref:hypothetical protein n=1 Tax=Thermocrinis albus TaxID=136094 RepID=UPI001FDEEC51|nr:hypothetical protein [Thermocrinis albus]